VKDAGSPDGLKSCPVPAGARMGSRGDAGTITAALLTAVLAVGAASTLV
jgi:hypothetical protein